MGSAAWALGLPALALLFPDCVALSRPRSLRVPGHLLCLRLALASPFSVQADLLGGANGGGRGISPGLRTLLSHEMELGPELRFTEVPVPAWLCDFRPLSFPF